MLSCSIKVSMVCLYADTSPVMFKWVPAPEGHRLRVCRGVGRAYERHLSHAQSWPWGRAWTGNGATAGVWWIGSLLACIAHRSLRPVSISIDLLWLIKIGDMFSVEHTMFQRWRARFPDITIHRGISLTGNIFLIMFQFLLLRIFFRVLSIFCQLNLFNGICLKHPLCRPRLSESSCSNLLVISDCKSAFWGGAGTVTSIHLNLALMLNTLLQTQSHSITWIMAWLLQVGGVGSGPTTPWWIFLSCSRRYMQFHAVWS